MAARSRVMLPALRALWLTAPLWGGVTVGDGGSGPLAAAATVLLWIGWAVALIALLVRSTVSLTCIRLVIPAALIGALMTGRGPWWFVTLGGGLITLALAFSADIGHAFIDGSAYGNERRFPLRAPAGVLLAAPVVWAIDAVGIVGGALLLADHHWVLGSVAVVVGLPLAFITTQSLHRLSRRFAVLVPAGLVVHDPIVLAETALFRKAQIARVGLAARDTGAVDFTGGAAGLAVEVQLVEDCIVTLAAERPGQAIEPKAVRAVIFTPSRPGRLLEAWASGRR